MAKHELSSTTFTKAEEQKFNKFVTRIESAYKATNKSMLDIAGSIAAIAENKLFRVDGYQNIYDLCKERFGISRGTVSNCVNVWKEYGDSKTGELLPEFKDYSFNQLAEMRKLPDNVRETITVETPVSEIKEKLRESKKTEESESESESVQTSKQKRETVKLAILLDDTMDRADSIMQAIYNALSSGKDILITELDTSESRHCADK